MGAPDSERALRASLRRNILAGTFVIATLVGGVGAWAAVSTLAGAVVASGRVVVQDNVKKVQHPVGGVVGEIRVQDGDLVKAGDLLIRLDETVTRANMAIYESQLLDVQARAARLRAERAGKARLELPPELEARRAEPRVADVLDSEQRLLEARLKTREGRRKRLSERIAQLNEEIEGLEAQLEAKGKEIELTSDERADLEGLAEKKLVQRGRLTALDRDKIRLEGEHGMLAARIAETKGRINEAELEILGIDEEFMASVLDELRQAEGQAPQIEEKLTAARDQLARIEVRAPIDGLVHQLAVHTIGGVVQPGETIMLIVPANDRLQVEARVMPQDIDQLHVGQPARLHFSAFSSRNMPNLFGTVRRVSAESTEDERTGMAYYTVRIEPDEGETDKLKGQALVPGMPVEVFLTTGERSALSWLMKPLTDTMGRALRED